MGRMQRLKGARGEREWRDFLRNTWHCPDAIRGRQYRGGDDSPDVRNGVPGTHAEVKRCEALSLYKAMEQAIGDCPEGDIPYVAHKRNHKPWLVVLQADDALGFSKKLVEHVDWMKTCVDTMETERQADPSILAGKPPCIDIDQDQNQEGE